MSPLKLAALIGAFVALPIFASAQTSGNANVVTTCGTINGAAYATGQNRPITQDTNGNQCSAATFSGTVTANNASVGTNGTTAPTSSTQIASKDASGNLQPASSTNPVPATGSVSVQLLTNASSSGSSVTIAAGGNFLFALSGTFGGTTVALTSTVNGVTTTLGSYTAAPSSAPCFAIATGTSVQATVTGGAPSGLNATLGAVGPGGCSGGGFTTPLTVTTTDKSGTISTGGTAQSAIASNTSRKGWCIQNPSSATEDLFVRVNGTASATTGTDLSAGQAVCNLPGMIDTSAVSVFAATTSHAFVGFEQQ